MNSEMQKLRERLEETEEVLEAIRSGRVDALVVPGPEGDRIYTLKGADQSYRVMIETMDEGAVILSPAGTILYCNRRFADMIRWPMEAVIGGSIEDLVVPEDMDRFKDLTKRAFGKEGIKAQMRFRANGETAVPALISMRNFRGEEDIDAVCMVVTDLTELKEKENRLREVALELQRKNAELNLRAEQLGRLSSELTMAEHRERLRLAKILHDHLQQLLVSARFGLETLEGRIHEDFWRTVENAVDVIKESLDVSRSLTVELSPPVLHEGGLVPAIEWLSRWMKEKHGLTVQVVETEPVGDLAREDVRTLLFSSVRELLLNVIKHASVTEARVEASRPDNRRVRIKVSDQGAGFDPDRTRSEAHDATSGFGLFSICERLLLMGGECRVESSPGRGTTVTLTTPIRGAGHAGEAEGEVKEEFPGTLRKPHRYGPDRERTGAGIRVMLVDDHAVMRQGLSMLLSDYSDIEVMGEAQDGKGAVQMARDLHPDVILMDISMPNMNGIEATRIIHSEHPDIKIIGLSMFDAADQAEAIRQAGAAAYLKKTGDKNQLLETIRSAVSARK